MEIREVKRFAPGHAVKKKKKKKKERKKFLSMNLGYLIQMILLFMRRAQDPRYRHSGWFSPQVPAPCFQGSIPIQSSSSKLCLRRDVLEQNFSALMWLSPTLPQPFCHINASKSERHHVNNWCGKQVHIWKWPAEDMEGEQGTGRTQF